MRKKERQLYLHFDWARFAKFEGCSHHHLEIVAEKHDGGGFFVLHGK